MKTWIVFAASVLAVTCSADAQTARPKLRPATPAPKAKPAPEEPKAPPVYYEFKGARIGMTLAEWKAVPIPPLFESSPTEPSILKGWCSNETAPDGSKLRGFLLSKQWSDAGVIQCKYARLQVSGSLFLFGMSGVKIGDKVAASTTYNFVNGKLFLIEIDASADLLADVIDGLTAKWGKPTTDTNDTTQTKSGATFPHTVKVWTNPVATIVMESPYGSIDAMNVTYSDNAAMAALKAAEEKANPAANKM